MYPLFGKMFHLQGGGEGEGTIVFRRDTPFRGIRVGLSPPLTMMMGIWV
jgi:hypothetical protein